MLANLRFVLGLALALAVHCASAANAVQNPDFSGGISAWSPSAQTGGGAYYDFSFGSPSAGTLRLDATSDGAIAQASQCVDIHKFKTLDFALRYFVNVQSGSGFHQFKLDIFDAPACTGNELATLYPIEAAATPVTGTNPGWLEAGDYAVTPPLGAMSARVDFSVAGGTPSSTGAAGYMTDHVQVGPIDVVFADDFEP